MKKNDIGTVLAIALLAVALSIISLSYHRLNATVTGNVCEVTTDNPYGYCYEALPAGGFPLSYVYDNGGLSVMGTLSFEDKFIAWRFFADVLFYLLALGLVRRTGRWLRLRSQS